MKNAYEEGATEPACHFIIKSEIFNIAQIFRPTAIRHKFATQLNNIVLVTKNNERKNNTHILWQLLSGA